MSPEYSSLIAELGKPCLPVTGGSQIPKGARPMGSYLGLVTHALPGEVWPCNASGRPLPPLVQLDLRAWPERPAILADLEIITVFMEPYGDTGLRNGEGWCLRAYPRAENLVPVSSPHFDTGDVPALQLVWGNVSTDMPFLDQAPDEKHTLLRKYITSLKGLEFCSPALKLGGYAHQTQGSVDFCDTVPNEDQVREFGFSYMDTRLPNPANPEFAFQVASMHELKFYYMDMGILYFARGTGDHRNEWFQEGAGT